MKGKIGICQEDEIDGIIYLIHQTMEARRFAGRVPKEGRFIERPSFENNVLTICILGQRFVERFNRRRKVE